MIMLLKKRFILYSVSRFIAFRKNREIVDSSSYNFRFYYLESIQLSIMQSPNLRSDVFTIWEFSIVK